MDTATGLAAIWLGFVAAMGLVSWAMSSTVGGASRKSERASQTIGAGFRGERSLEPGGCDAQR